MGLASSFFQAKRDEFSISRKIDGILLREKQNEQSQIKLLLLGSSNSGKSTVMKQFQIIHKMGFSAEERKVFRDQLWKSAIESMKTLVRARQDYISTHNLNTSGLNTSDSNSGNEHHAQLQHDELEPYLQHLVSRVTLDQGLHEEVDIPIAASTSVSPRASAVEFTSSLEVVNSMVLSQPPSTLAMVESPLTPPQHEEEDVHPQENERVVDKLLQETTPLLLPPEPAPPCVPTDPHALDKTKKRTFSSQEEEMQHWRKKYLARPHKHTKEFSSTEEELAFYRARNRKKKERYILEQQQQQQNDLDTTKKPLFRYSWDSTAKKSFDDSNSCNSSGGGGSTMLSPVTPKASHSVLWDRISVGRLLQKIWRDPIIQHCFQQQEDNLNLDAPLGYIMKEMDRMCEKGYQPTNDDVLNCRIRTFRVNHLEFEAYETKFVLIDVGGQKSERKFWLKYFDRADVIIFVVGLDQYDQIEPIDGENKLMDALKLFEEMCSNPWFRTSSFLLFLNKADLFATKIRQVPLTVCFKKQVFTGDPHDYDATTKFIIKRFQTIHAKHMDNYRQEVIAQNHKMFTSPKQLLSLRKSSRDQQPQQQVIPQLYFYITCATDTESMKFIIHMCRDIFLKKEMARFGFIDV